RLRAVNRLLSERADGHQGDHHDEDAQDRPAPAPDGAPVIEEMDLPLLLARAQNIKHDRIVPPKRPLATCLWAPGARKCAWERSRSEEHTSELQSRFDLVCRLLL